MCGIIGYVGHRSAIPLVLEGLHRLEYRGYDSAGIAYTYNGQIHVQRKDGKLQELEALLAEQPPLNVNTGMGHTRWATHGAPSVRNAHPHTSNDDTFAIVHNGIIENFLELKAELSAKGYVFHSDTDTEVLVNLVQECFSQEHDIQKAFAKALQLAKGTYSVCLMYKAEPDVLYAARMSAPLIFGLGENEYFLASDIPAFLNYTRKVIFLQDGEMIRLSQQGYEIYNLETLERIEPTIDSINWDMQSAQKGGYRHFMIKEIFEQPRVIQDCLLGRVHEHSEQVTFTELDTFPIPKRLTIVACGTSFHAGLWGRHVLERYAQLPVQVEIASEFRYKEQLFFAEGDMVLVISQSGETADTLAALRRVKALGVPVLGLCNVVGSSLARDSDAVIYTQAGPEISVASTKAMCSQMLLLVLLALYWGGKKGTLPKEQAQDIVTLLQSLSSQIGNALPAMQAKAKELAYKYAAARNFFYIGRGHCYPLALEGALKLKELSYIHAEGYASGEMKHGPIALIDPYFPTFALCPDDELLPKVVSNIVEIQARQGQVIALTNCDTDLSVNDIWNIPRLADPFSAFLLLPALQLFSYEVAYYLGKDVDQPRNLAKSVTVE